MSDERGPLRLRRFVFDRQTDVSGTSGVGAVVEGVEFSDGQIVLRWRTEPHSSIAIYRSMEAAVYIHGHDGSTNLHYLDEAAVSDPAATRLEALGPRSMETVRNWLGLDLWLALGHDFTEWTGWTADVWADMMAEARAALRLAD